MQFAIIRTKKLKTYGNITGSCEHNFRTRPTENADPERTHLNRTTGAQSVEEAVAKIRYRLDTVPIIRTNAVLAIEYLVSASPGWFSSPSGKMQDAYFDATSKWLTQRHGPMNVICCTLHLDETSPHLSVLIVPIDPKGRLNCSYFQDGREKLRGMQTQFASEVGQQFGLERGIEGSRAKHTSIKNYYADVNASPPSIQTKVRHLPLFPQKQSMLERLSSGKSDEDIQIEYQTALGKYKVAVDKDIAELREQIRNLSAKVKRFEIEKANNKDSERAFVKLRENSVQLKTLPMALVLQKLGAILQPQKGPLGPNKTRETIWQTRAGPISVVNDKFCTQGTVKTKGGSVALVMLLNEMSHHDAVQWMVAKFGASEVVEDCLVELKAHIQATAEKPAQIFQMPKNHLENWSSVRNWLSSVHYIGNQLIDSLHAAGKLYADKFKNAVFVLGNSEGAEFFGPEPISFHGFQGENHFFILDPTDIHDKRLIFVSSALDAISFRTLGFNGRILSLSGNVTSSIFDEAEKYRRDGYTVHAAFEKGSVGDTQQQIMGKPCKELRSTYENWSAELRKKGRIPLVEADKKTPSTIRSDVPRG